LLRSGASASCFGVVRRRLASEWCVGVLLRSRASASCFGVVRRRLASEKFDSTQTCGDVTQGLGTDGKIRDRQAPTIVLHNSPSISNKDVVDRDSLIFPNDSHWQFGQAVIWGQTANP
jgi:hypothetical protein